MTLSDLITIWIWSHGTSLAAALARGGWGVWQGVRALRKGRNGATRWLFILTVLTSFIFVVLAGVGLLIGVYQSGLPRPVTSVGQERLSFTALALTGLAAITAIYNVAALVIEVQINRLVDHPRKWDGLERRQR